MNSIVVMGAGFNPAFMIIMLIVGPLVGYLIGKNKGLGGVGAALGLLGLIGWIIVAVMKGNRDQQQRPPM